MLKDETQLLVSQIRQILLNKPIHKHHLCETEELKELQSAIFYLADCMEEFNTFMVKLCAGELHVETPSKENFLAGYLKELNAILRHLTWQATKVAEGDYQQRVTFLGEFSTAFNKMIEQLEEREIHLKKKSEALLESTRLLQTIMDQQEERVLVLDLKSDKFLFTNQSTRKKLYNPDTGLGICGKPCSFIGEILNHKGESDYKTEYYCNISEKHLSVRGVSLTWIDQYAYAYFVADVTKEREKMNTLEDLVYLDPLTSLYNRRYCLEILELLSAQGDSYSLILLDLDYLKVVNDTFGHEIGDEYIKKVAALLEAESRGDDAICRIGGDEFVVIWKNCEKTVAKRKMKQIQKHLNDYQTSYPMSISYGVVQVDPEQVLDAEVILKQADRKMYQMKKSRKIQRGVGDTSGNN